MTLANGCDTNPREIEGYWRQFGRRFGHQLPTSAAMRDDDGSLFATGTGVLDEQDNVAYLEFAPA